MKRTITQHIGIAGLVCIVAGAFALVSCGTEGGGGGQANSPPSGSSDNLPSAISFSKPSDNSKSVIGLREFLLTVAYSESATKEYNFIVNTSSTAPAWSTIENSQALISRTFNNTDLQTREIYFSVTIDYQPTPHNALVDLSTDSETKYPGLITPNTSYYVHAYSDGKHSTTSDVITTANYPASLPPAITEERSAADNTKGDNYLRALWGMDMWKRTSDGTEISLEDATADRTLLLHTIEWKRNEPVYLPFRTIPMHAGTNTTCLSKAVSRVYIRYFDINKSDVLQSLTYPQAAFGTNNPTADTSVLFKGYFSNEYYDILHKLDTGNSIIENPDIVRNNTNCGPTIVSFYHPGYRINIIEQ